MALRGVSSAAAKPQAGIKYNRMGGLWKDVVRDRWLYFMFLPILCYFLLFKYGAMYGIVIAFKDFRMADGIFGSPWVGMKYFTRLFQSGDFYGILGNTLRLSFYSIIFGFPVPIILALLLNEVRNARFKKTVQSIIYVPFFISWIVLGGIITSLLSPSTGLVNNLIKGFGGTPIYFMANNGWWQFVYILSGIWQGAGWGTVIYLAAIAGIDTEIYEAAVIDGANRFRQMINITLPSIKITIAILFILRMGSVLEVGFDQIFALQNEMVTDVSEVISTYEFRAGVQGMQYSQTTALGLFKGIVNLIMIGSANFAVSKMTDGEAGL